MFHRRRKKDRSGEGPTFSSCENGAVWISQNTNRVSAGDLEVSSPTITDRSREGPTFSSRENGAVWISQNTNRVSAGDMEVSSPTITKEQTPYWFGSRPVKSVCPSATVGSNGINERRMGLHVASGVAKAENAVSRFLSRLRPAELLSGDSNLSLGQSNDTDFLASIYAEQPACNPGVP